MSKWYGIQFPEKDKQDCFNIWKLLALTPKRNINYNYKLLSRGAKIKTFMKGKPSQGQHLARRTLKVCPTHPHTPPVHTLMHTCIHSYMHMHNYPHMHSHTRTPHMHTHPCNAPHTPMHTHMHSCTCTPHMNAHAHTSHTCTPMHMHAHPPLPCTQACTLMHTPHTHAHTCTHSWLAKLQDSLDQSI